jgi:hypothetical protein
LESPDSVNHQLDALTVTGEEGRERPFEFRMQTAEADGYPGAYLDGGGYQLELGRDQDVLLQSQRGVDLDFEHRDLLWFDDTIE